MLNKLVMQSNKNLQRVFTKKVNGLNDMDSAVNIKRKTSKTNKDGSVVLNLFFENGRKVIVTYVEG
mgnify:CR=1 FL=1